MRDRADPIRFAVMVNPRTGTPFLNSLLEHKLRPELIVTRDPFFTAHRNVVLRMLRQLRLGVLYLSDRNRIRAHHDTYFIAKEHNIPTFPAQIVNTDRCKWVLDALELDYIFVSSFPIIRDFIFTIPSSGCVNFHPSLLPRHRGASPDFWTIKDEDRVSGITFHLIDEGVDTGEIIAQFEVPLNEMLDSSILSRYLAEIGAKKFVELIYRLILGTSIPQINRLEAVASYERPVGAADRQISLEMDADEIMRVVKASRAYGYAQLSTRAGEIDVMDAFELGGTDPTEDDMVTDEHGNITIRSKDDRALYCITTQTSPDQG